MSGNKMKLVMKLTQHVGRQHAVNMAELYECIYDRPVQKLVNDTRRLRELIETVRREGVPVCSRTDSSGGGYYLASAGSELDSYCQRLRKSALKKLAVEAKLRRLGLPELLGQISLKLAQTGDVDGGSQVQSGLDGTVAEAGHCA
jgi:hypothetical protein